MMLVTTAIACLLGLALSSPIPQQPRLDDYEVPISQQPRLDDYQEQVPIPQPTRLDDYQIPVLPTLEPKTQSPSSQIQESTQSLPEGQATPGNQVAQQQVTQSPPAPQQSSSLSTSSDQTQSVESQSESSQEVTSDESPEDTASEQTTSEQSSESLPNTSEDTTSEEMTLTTDPQQLRAHLLDDSHGDTQDNSMGSEENMRRSRILAFGIPLHPQLAPEPPVAIATGSPVPGAVSVPPVAVATDIPASTAGTVPVATETDSIAADSLESSECTVAGDNGACVRDDDGDAPVNPAAEGEHHGPSLGLLMLEEERGQLQL